MLAYALAPLDREMLRGVIEGPAKVARLCVGNGLVAHLVADTDSGEALDASSPCCRPCWCSLRAIIRLALQRQRYRTLTHPGRRTGALAGALTGAWSTAHAALRGEAFCVT